MLVSSKGPLFGLVFKIYDPVLRKTSEILTMTLVPKNGARPCITFFNNSTGGSLALEEDALKQQKI